MASAGPIEEIKERLSIVDIVGQRVPLKKAGRTFKGLCPFHNEKTPSFIVSPDRGTYHCFGCGEGGDIFTFVMKSENLDFPEALETLAQRAGVTIKPRAVAAQEDEKRERIYSLNAAAAQFYYNILRADLGRLGYDYLKRRGVTDATMESWQLGYAPDAWDALIKYLTARGHEPAALVEAGLAVERENGIRDTFRGRVLFPIRDHKGNILGFGGRTLGDVQPKYLNTPASPVFDKGGCLFGIDAARSAIRETGRAVIVEGYMDALIAHQYGIRNVVGALGTALTDRQVGLLKRLTKTVVLALDADAAGEKAALKGLEVAREVYGESVPVPQPGGLVRLEQRLDADLRIATLPEGLDPDEVIRRDPAEWHRLIDAAKPTVDFYLDTILGKADLDSAKGVSEAAQRLLPVIGEVRDGVQRSFYIAQLARKLKIGEDALRAELHRGQLSRSSPRRPTPRRREETAVVRAPRRDAAVFNEYYIELALEMFRRQGRAPNALVPDNLRGSIEAQTVLGWLSSRVGQPSENLLPVIEAARSELTEPIADWLAVRMPGEHGAALLDDAKLNAEIEHCAREVRRRNLRWQSEDLAEMMRQATSDDGEAGRSERDLIAAAEALLAQLHPVEIAATRSGVWRPTEPAPLSLPPTTSATAVRTRPAERRTPSASIEPAPPPGDTFTDESSDSFDSGELDELPPDL